MASLFATSVGFLIDVFHTQELTHHFKDLVLPKRFEDHVVAASCQDLWPLILESAGRNVDNRKFIAFRMQPDLPHGFIAVHDWCPHDAIQIKSGASFSNASSVSWPFSASMIEDIL
jgi:hypothetical protein